MSTATDVGTIIADANSVAAAWYNGIAYHGPVYAPSPAELTAANSLGNTQAAFAAQNPTLAGLLIQPGFIILAIAVIVLVILTRK
jgi:hypothetical protein